MRILITSFICFLATCLPGQCIDVRVDSVFCLANGEYGILYDVEGTGEAGWVLEGYNVSGSYFTDEILSLTGLFGPETNLLFRDSINADCVLEVSVQAPDGCGTTDPCFGFGLEISATPNTCGRGLRVTVFPDDVGIPDTIFVRDQAGDIVRIGFVPDFPNFLDFNDLEPGTYTVSTTVNGACTLTADAVVSGATDCGSIEGFVWTDDNEDGLRTSDERELNDVRIELLDAPTNEVVAVQFSNPNGYSFSDVSPGSYRLRFTPNVTVIPTAYQVGDDRTIDNDVNADFFTEQVTVGSNEAIRSIDGGFLPAPCSVVLISDDVTCNGANDGSAFADPSGQAPFTFEWSNGATTQTIANLAAGVYTVTVTNNDGCSSVGSVVINEPTALIVDIQAESIPGDNTGGVRLTAEVSGGTPPYAYSWSFDGEVRCAALFCDELMPGEELTLTIVDANGCTNESSGETGDCNDASINFFSPFYLACDGGPVTISTGDTTEYDYTWVSPGGETLSGHTIEATEVGTYSISGTISGSSCEISGEAVVMSAPFLPEISLQVIDSSECGFGNCVYPVFEDTNDQGGQVSFTWYGPNGDVLQTNGFLCTQESGLFVLVAEGLCDTQTLSIELNTSVECADLYGTVYIDDAANCSFDAGDLPAPGILVHIASTDGTRNYYAVTNEDGEYGQEVETGEYTVTPITDPSRPFGQCDPAATVTVVAGQPNQLDVYLPVLLSCPLLTVDVSMPFLRRCFLSCAYIEYENEGSAVAEDAQLVVTLDPLFIGVDPSIVPSMIDGNTYTFDLGDLPPFASGRIFFNFTVSCDAELGQAHCLEAEITPNDICTPPEGWNGALVSVDPGMCDGNEVAFRIANIGDNEMSVPLSYVVVEDGIMMTPVPVIVEELSPDEIFTITLPADGQTYQVITNQEPNAPASENPTALLEGCTGNTVNGGSTGFANILSLGNGFPSEAIVCRENVGAYDPNDKNGFPRGHGAENNIAPGTELDYAIRFQNTGTDTAFNIVIRDTISEALDLSTFKAGSSSHDYTVAIDSQRVVTFTFANIMLPDSNVNLLASQGVVNFSIDHDSSLVAGDLITNEAAIYFDFNEPIITNLSQHQIEKDGLPVSVRTLRAQEVGLRVFPNPSNGFIQLDVPNNDVSYNDVLTITDLYGRQVAKTTYGQIGSGWNVRTLPAGYYLLVVHDEAGRARGRAGFIIAE